MDSRAIMAAFAMLSIALAGCTSDEGDTADGAISIVSLPTDATTPLVLEATVDADEYVWNMGDGRAKLSGKTIEHVYGVTDGTFKVELTTKTGGESKSWAPLNLVLGSGENEAPQLAWVLEYNWVQVGEEFTLSAASSTDPEGDPILVQWFCSKKTDIGPVGGGDDHSGGGVQFGTGSVSVIATSLAEGAEMPEADRTVEGDFCGSMSTSTYTEDTTIKGAFAERGIYELTLLAKDPGHAGVPGIVTLYVTDTPRVEALQTMEFTGTIARGAPQAADEAANQADSADHIVRHDFDIEYPITSVSMSFANDGGDGVPVSMEYEVYKGSTKKVGPQSEDLSGGKDFFSTGDHQLVLYLRSGSNVGYTVNVTYEYITDPSQLFEAPGGH